MIRDPDAVVVGSGPNGLAAALTLARAGLAVQVIEGAGTPGGGCRTEELTLPGFRHDICSAVHPLAAASPFFLGTDLAAHGVRLLMPEIPYAHPLDGSRAGVACGPVAQTAAGLGQDAAAYRRLMSPLVRDAAFIVPQVLAPLLRSVPGHPIAMSRFGLAALRSAARLATRFETDQARAMLAGAAAHAMLPLDAPLTAGYGLLFMLLAHSAGWPVAEGGSSAITSALIAELNTLGGQVSTGCWVSQLAELPRARAVLLDVSPRQFLKLAAGRLPPRYASALGRFSYGPGVCKVDWALAGPVPWQAPACREAGTVHVGGTFAEVARSESDVAAGPADAPFCLFGQPGVVDPSRAPAGKHTAWAYCHVPPGSTVDMTDRIEAQIERFAPGFRDLILARSVRTAAGMEQHNPNYIGGDINGGAGTLRQTLFRPVPRWNPYRTPLRGVYLCSSSTPPGGGVHGMCGMWAARTALADLGMPRR